jgi:small conductance mechanosensitive channel
MNLDHVRARLTDEGLHLGLAVLGAIVLWIVGRAIIRAVVRVVGNLLRARRVDETLVHYARSALGVVLNIALVIAVLGFFGVETTSFAAILAAVGIAIGMAWSGLLANFAAGVFLLVLKPFKVGDLIGGAGVVGTVKELGLFATTIETSDGIVTFVGNNKLFGDNIQNMTASHARRVDLTAQLAHGVDPADARARLAAAIAGVPHVLATPAPVIELLEVTALGPVLAVRPYTDNAYYWDVYFAGNAAIGATLGAAGYPAPRALQEIRTLAA